VTYRSPLLKKFQSSTIDKREGVFDQIDSNNAMLGSQKMFRKEN
jgi:hypothetical protein